MEMGLPSNSDFQKVCRTCLMERTDNHASLHENEIIRWFIETVSEIKIIEGDGLPKIICNTCKTKVEDALKFVEDCKKNDEILRNKFNPSIIKSEDDVKDYIDEDVISVTSNHIEFCNIDENSAESMRNITSTEMLKDIQLEYFCEICRQHYLEKNEFNNHQRNHVFECEYCSKTFSELDYLNVHKVTHMSYEGKQYACEEENFPYHHSMEQHESKHKIRQRFRCTECSKGCLTQASLNRHKRIHDPKYHKRILSCNFCEKKFEYPSLLEQHVRCHTGFKPHLCSDCGKSFRQIGALHYHQRIHTGEKRFTCDTCQEKFISQSVLRVHIRKHTKEKPYVCEECGVSFRQISDLKCHKRSHTGERTALCTICGKKYTTSGQLTVHLRTHTGEKPFKCESCLKAFITKSMLVKHRRIHTGERPYVCDVCGKAFNQRSTLNTHFKIHKRKKETNGKGQVEEMKEEYTVNKHEEIIESDAEFVESDEKGFIRNIETEV